MILRLAFATALIFMTGPTLYAAPSANNSSEALLDKYCSDLPCVDSYRVKFRQISYEPSREQLTLAVTLSPKEGIRYPIITDKYEAQMTQQSFAAICRFKGIESNRFQSLIKMPTDESLSDFHEGLKLCLQGLADKTESALGR